MKTLIIYYSFSENNEFLAREIQRRLTCDIQKIVEIHKRTGLMILLDLIFKRNSKIERFVCDLQQYDRLILVGPIWNGKIATPLRAFIDLEKENFKDYSFITVCTGPEGQEQKIIEELLQSTQKQPAIVMQPIFRTLSVTLRHLSLNTSSSKGYTFFSSRELLIRN